MAPTTANSGDQLTRLLAGSPLQAAAMRAGPRRLRVMAYHGVSSDRRFAAQLDWLTAHSTVVPLAAVARWIHAGEALPSRAVLITFDDGERSVLETGLPLLEARGLPAVAFVIAGLIDTDQPFWWAEVEHLLRDRGEQHAAAVVKRLKTVSDRERRGAIDHLRTAASSQLETNQLSSDEVRMLRDGGVDIGNHSLTHPCLDQCDDRELEEEIWSAHRRLTDLLGEPPGAFAYPNGNVDDRVAACVADAGYRLAFAFDHRIVRRSPDPIRISRIRVSADAPLDEFRVRVSGLHPLLHAARGRS